jgi:hypothetical protein
MKMILLFTAGSLAILLFLGQADIVAQLPSLKYNLKTSEEIWRGTSGEYYLIKYKEARKDYRNALLSIVILNLLSLFFVLILLYALNF